MHDKVSKFQFVKFGAKSNDIIYYVDGNLFYKDNPRTNIIVNLTSDGKHGMYQYGLPDWLYEGETW